MDGWMDGWMDGFMGYQCHLSDKPIEFNVNIKMCEEMNSPFLTENILYFYLNIVIFAACLFIHLFGVVGQLRQ